MLLIKLREVKRREEKGREGKRRITTPFQL
jgi:hypothetical protein